MCFRDADRLRWLFGLELVVLWIIETRAGWMLVHEKVPTVDQAARREVTGCIDSSFCFLVSISIRSMEEKIKQPNACCFQGETVKIWFASSFDVFWQRNIFHEWNQTDLRWQCDDGNLLLYMCYSVGWWQAAFKNTVNCVMIMWVYFRKLLLWRTNKDAVQSDSNLVFFSHISSWEFSPDWTQRRFQLNHRRRTLVLTCYQQFGSRAKDGSHSETGPHKNVSGPTGWQSHRAGSQFISETPSCRLLLGVSVSSSGSLEVQPGRRSARTPAPRRRNCVLQVWTNLCDWRRVREAARRSAEGAAAPPTGEGL